MNPTRGGWVILLTIVFGMILSVARLPDFVPSWAGWLRPQWVVLVLFFWVIEFPDRVGMILAWCLGFLLDALNAEPLGINGLCLATITFIAWSFHERLRMYSIAQQAAVLFVLVIGVQYLRASVQSLTLDTPVSLALAVPAVTSAILWPFVAGALRGVSQRFRVR